ncbi:SP_0198 family lipoprotein [Streptococcus respiraculi]|uniref:SP_0198 family lipoprotein n=1 Tax=Streptococcus respiraculi TaxID=2021971 RepID=UPI000E7536C4|nr:SP_0198 family lipoprotein [Streptococcus respiraculi]
MKFTKIISFTTVAAFLLFLVACGNTQNQTAPASSSPASTVNATSQTSSIVSSQATSASSATTPAAATQTGDLDGTYKGRDEEDEVTLVITGTSGTWTQVEPDGEQEIKNVTIDPSNQRIIIGDDTERYFLDGNTLTIEDISEDDFNDTVVLTKQ